MKFSEVESLGGNRGKYPGSLPEDPLDVRARRDFIKEFTEWVFPGYAAQWQHVVKTCTERACRTLSEKKAKSVNRAWFNFQLDKLIFSYPWMELRAQGEPTADWPYAHMTSQEVKEGCTKNSAVYAKYLAQKRVAEASKKPTGASSSMEGLEGPATQSKENAGESGELNVPKDSSSIGGQAGHHLGGFGRPSVFDNVGPSDKSHGATGSVPRLNPFKSGIDSAGYAGEGSKQSSEKSLSAQNNVPVAAQWPHQGIAHSAFAPEVRAEISVKTLLEPMSNHGSDHQKRSAMWERFFGSSATLKPIVGPFQLKLDNLFPSQILASSERLESLNKSFSTVQLTLDRQSRVLTVGFAPGQGPSDVESRTAMLRTWDAVKGWTTSVYSGVPEYLDQFILKHVAKGCVSSATSQAPLYQACEDICESYPQAHHLVSIAEAREKARHEFQNMRKGHLSESQDRLKDWLEKYPGDKRIALSIAVAEWSDNCDLTALSAALQRSDSAGESFRNNSL